MKSYALIMIVLGAGSFILPLFGLQFRLLTIFGSATPYLGAGLAVLGVVILVAGGGKGQQDSGGQQ